MPASVQEHPQKPIKLPASLECGGLPPLFRRSMSSHYFSLHCKLDCDNISLFVQREPVHA
jgi:hypothetical protein